jgi:hypothetical protein
VTANIRRDCYSSIKAVGKIKARSTYQATLHAPTEG